MLYTRDTGRGQRVLFLHAFPLNSRMWEPQVDALAARARLLAPDRLAAEVEARGVEVAASEFVPKLLGATTQRVRPAVVERVREIIRENTPAGVAAALRAMAVRPDSTPLLASIRCPVLCVAGEEDMLTPPEV